MTPLLLLVLCAATYRATRLIGQDAITQPVRDRLDAWADAGTRALDKHRAPSLLSRVGAWLGEMIGCPWCLSTWLGLVAALVWWAAQGTPDPLMWIPAVALTCSAFAGVVSTLVGLAEDADG